MGLIEMDSAKANGEVRQASPAGGAGERGGVCQTGGIHRVGSARGAENRSPPSDGSPAQGASEVASSADDHGLIEYVVSDHASSFGIELRHGIVYPTLGQVSQCFSAGRLRDFYKWVIVWKTTNSRLHCSSPDGSNRKKVSGLAVLMCRF